MCGTRIRGKGAEYLSNVIAFAQRIQKFHEPRRHHAMGRDPEHYRVRRPDPVAGSRKIRSSLPRQPRQQIRRAHVREKANVDLGHGEGKPIAHDPQHTVHGDTDATAHAQAIHQRHIGLRVVLDHRVDRIFLAPEIDRFLGAPGPVQIVERADVAAGAKRPPARGLDHDAGDRRILRP